MTLSIKSGKADLAVVVAPVLRQRLKRERRRRGKRGGIAERLNQIAKDCAALPDLDPRSPEEIIGYAEFGVPH